MSDITDTLDRIADQVRWAASEVRRPTVSAASTGLGQDVEVEGQRLRALVADVPEEYRARVSALAERARLAGSGLQDYKGARSIYAGMFERLAKDISTLAATLTSDRV
jgi:hypothetical protein